MPYQTKQPGYTVDDRAPADLTIKENSLERLAELGKSLMNNYMACAWIENDSSGFTGWRWDRYNATLYIVNAANRYKDIIVTGPRHYSNLMVLAIDALGGIDLLREYAGDEYEQGFVDQYGTFYNREEAMVLATERGQVRYTEDLPTTELYSEHLY